MADTAIFNASDFKSTCLEILDRVSGGDLERVVITKRGRVVGVLIPPETSEAAIRRLYGALKGSVVIPRGFDLTQTAWGSSTSKDWP